MLIYPAIDMYEQKAVRLYKGDYAQMTVYSENPCAVAQAFKDSGATHIHLVDLEGAKFGTTSNLPVIEKIVKATDLFVEVGGGIRDMDTIKKYVEAGIDRVILGTAAVKDPAFLQAALDAYGDKIAVGVDIKDGFVAIKGWTQTSSVTAEDFFSQMYGVVLSGENDACRIEIRAYGGHAHYLRSLPLHHSQREISTGEEYTDFEYFLAPTYDFLMALLGMGTMVEILKPTEFRDKFTTWVCNLSQMYRV